MTLHKTILFISSYIPLYVLMILKNLFERITNEGRFVNVLDKFNRAIFFDEVNDYAIIILFAFCITSYIYLYKKLEQTTGEKYYKLESISDETSNYYFSYISIYLLSCLGLSLNSIVDVFVFTFLMILVGYIYITNDMIYMNPTLQLFGYKVYNTIVVSESTREKIDSVVISKNTIKLKVNDRIRGTGKSCFLFVDKIENKE